MIYIWGGDSDFRHFEDCGSGRFGLFHKFDHFFTTSLTHYFFKAFLPYSSLKFGWHLRCVTFYNPDIDNYCVGDQEIELEQTMSIMLGGRGGEIGITFLKADLAGKVLS